jgi:hypothetical protein
MKYENISNENKCKQKNIDSKWLNTINISSKIKTQSISFWTEKLLYIYKDHDASIIAVFDEKYFLFVFSKETKEKFINKKYWHWYQWFYL